MQLDALALANELDAAWHDQPRAFEREAITRFWGLLTLPARVLDPMRPREMLRSATVLRNARFKGDPVKAMFFADKDFTEVDGLFLQVGSSLGHARGDDAWVVEVERKTAHEHADYYVAIQRSRRFADYLSRQFHLRARPVVIFEDDEGKLNYDEFDGEVLVVPMSALRARTQGLTFPALADLPGVASDKTLVKLALIRQLVATDPLHPGWYSDALSLTRDMDERDRTLHLPVVGHQDAGHLPGTIEKWLARERETDSHLAERADRYLDELYKFGVLDRRLPAPRLSHDGGQAVLRLLRSENEGPR